MAFWSRLTAAIAGLGVGEAAGVALEPVLDPLKQDAWARNTPRVLELGELAQLAASGLISQDAAHTEGARSGYSPDRVDRAIQLVLEAAPVAELLELWRRGKISEQLVDHGLAKARIEPQYWDAIKELFYGRLSPQEVALGIVRSIIDSAGLQVGENDTSGGVVPAYPVSPIDPLLEAQADGIDRERLRVLVGEIGLPMSLQQAASAYFRKIIELPDFYKAVAQGDTRPAWGPFILEQARQILTAHDYAELQLRGYLNQTQRREGTAKHGMSTADSDLLYDVLGRGLSLHQAFIGIRRGGSLNGPTGQIPPWALYQLQRGNLRPEVYNLAWAAHETYPSAFVFRQLLKDGALTETEGRDYFLGMGWPQTLAEKAAAAYAVTTGPTADPHVAKAQSHLWSTVQTRYIAAEPGDVDPTAAFDQLAVPQSVRGEITALWDIARSYTRKRLTATQVKKAYRGAVTNPDTGQPWTLDDATNELISLGYSLDDAQTFLDI